MTIPADVALYFAVVTALSVPIWVAAAYVRPGAQILPGIPLSALAAFTPAIVAAMLESTHPVASARAEGMWRLFAGTHDVGRLRSPWMLAVDVLFHPILALLAYGSIRASRNARSLPMPQFGKIDSTTVQLFAMFLVAAFGEELGWTGYARSKLADAGYSSLEAGFVMGLFQAAWHWIPLTQAGRNARWIAWWTLYCLSIALVRSWLFDHAGPSVTAAAVLHATGNLCWQLFPVQGSLWDPMHFGLWSCALSAVPYVFF
ncbi:hypothetical protein HK405_007637 [Cladochytrium tenue]|nr:hypothetical protein HK405_007637 [Cladochytrium tenue]